jgi:hypothetical protein
MIAASLGQMVTANPTARNSAHRRRRAPRQARFSSIT